MILFELVSNVEINRKGHHNFNGIVTLIIRAAKLYILYILDENMYGAYMKETTTQPGRHCQLKVTDWSLINDE